MNSNSSNHPLKSLKLHYFPFLSGSEWLQLLPIVGTLSLLAYVTFQAFKSKPVAKDARVNLRIQKESSKVVNMVDIEELGDKVSYCRCWRSKRVSMLKCHWLFTHISSFMPSVP